MRQETFQSTPPSAKLYFSLIPWLFADVLAKYISIANWVICLPGISFHYDWIALFLLALFVLLIVFILFVVQFLFCQYF